MAFGSGGKLAYVTLLGTAGAIGVVDLATRTLVDTIPVGATEPGYVAISPGNDTLLVSTDTYASGSYKTQIIDIASKQVQGTVLTGDSAQGVAISPDGTRGYVVSLDGTISFVDMATANTVGTLSLPKGNAHQILLTADGKKAYVGTEGGRAGTHPGLFEIDTVNRTILREVELTGEYEDGNITMTADESTVHVVTGYGNNLVTIDVASFSVTSTTKVGTGIYGVVAMPEHDRVFVSSIPWEMVMSVDTTTNTRSPFARSTGEGSYRLFTDPSHKYLVTTDRYTTTLTFTDFPAASNPVDTQAAAGEQAQFSVATERFSTKSTTMQWQVSSDAGATWNAIDGANTADLAITASHTDNGNLYRMAFSDSFFGIDQTTEAARLTVPAAGIAPTITTPSLPDGTVDGSYGPAIVEAEGDPRITFTAQDLPNGLTIDATTGAISETPTVAGDFEITVTATNAFGSDTKTYPVSIDQTTVTPPTSDPSNPGDGNAPEELPVTGAMTVALIGIAVTLLGGGGLMLARKRFTTGLTE